MSTTNKITNIDPNTPLICIDPDILHAIDINREYGLATSSARDAVTHARECGRLLLEAKEDCLHGEWSEWIDVNFSGSMRTAQKFMRLANASSATHLTGDSLTDALAHIATPKQTKQPPEKPIGIVAVVRQAPQPTPPSVQLFKSKIAPTVLDADVIEGEGRPKRMGMELFQTPASTAEEATQSDDDDAPPPLIGGMGVDESKLPKWVPDDADRLWLLAKIDLDKILRKDKSRERVFLEIIKYCQDRLTNNR